MLKNTQLQLQSRTIKTPRLRAAGVFIFCGLILAGLAGCSARLYGSNALSADSHPELVSGSQTLQGQEIPETMLKQVQHKVRDDRNYVQDVPFYPGEEYQCGPSVLASALNYLGYDIKPEDISEEIYLHGIKGTLNIDMVSFARRFDDLTVMESRGDIIFLKENLSLGHPLIVFVDLGIWSIRKGHYMLVVGYDDSREGVIVYSGADRDKLIRYEDLMRIWKRGGYWTMRLTKE